MPKEADGGYTVSRGANLKFFLWGWHSAREGCFFNGAVGPQPVIEIYERRGSFVSPSPVKLTGVGYNFPIASTQWINITMRNSCDAGRLDQSVRVLVR